MMKKLTLITAISLFAGSVVANPFVDSPELWPQGSGDVSGDTVAINSNYVEVTDKQIYQGFAEGNLELATSYSSVDSLSAQPGIGDNLSMKGKSSVTTDNDIYHGFEIDNLEL